MIFTKKYVAIALLTVSSISTNNASLSQLSACEKTELAAALTRAAAVVTNAYVLQNINNLNTLLQERYAA